MKKTKGQLESPAKAKSRIKTFEKNLECGHRLALTYASNQPGETPPVPSGSPYMKAVNKRYGEAREAIKSVIGSAATGALMGLSEPTKPKVKAESRPLIPTSTRWQDYREYLKKHPEMGGPPKKEK